jgi:hypothetical protein
VVINSTSTNQPVVVKGAATTGVTVPALTRALVAWNGTDYALVASNRITDLTGTLATTNGGTGLTSFTANGAVYASSTSALTTGTLPVSGGGTGAATLTANNVLLGNGTSALQVVAPGTSGNVLTSNGTTWTSAAPVPAENKLMNGAMRISQRGTSFTGLVTSASGQYTLDRWAYLTGVTANTATVTVAKNTTDYPSNSNFYNSLRLTVTTADTSVASGDIARIGQAIEGVNLQELIGRTFTLSFWVRSSKTGTHCVSFTGTNAAAAGNSYVAEYTISAADTWEFKTITVTDGLQSSFAWRGGTGEAGVTVGFTLMCGSSYQAIVNTWTGGVPLRYVTAAGASTNLLDSTSNIFAITGVQLNTGSSTAFQFLSFEEDLFNCQRYYTKSYSFDVNPGTVTNGGQLRGTASSSNAAFTAVFPAELCKLPTFFVYSPATGTSGVVRAESTSSDVAVTGYDLGTRECSFYQTGSAGTTYATAHWVATAEI